MLLLFWGVGLLVRQANKTDLSGSAKTVLMVLPLCALLLAGLGNVLPREDYEQTGWAEEARLEIIDRLAAVGRGVTSAGADLGPASGTDQIDLSQAGPLDFDGDTALRVRSQTTGHIYLRGSLPPSTPAAAGNSCPTRCTSRCRRAGRCRFPEAARSMMRS